jgi:hypothetical protein
LYGYGWAKMLHIVRKESGVSFEMLDPLELGR